MLNLFKNPFKPKYKVQSGFKSKFSRKELMGKPKDALVDMILIYEKANSELFESGALGIRDAFNSGSELSMNTFKQLAETQYRSLENIERFLMAEKPEEALEIINNLKEILEKTNKQLKKEPDS